MFIVASIFTFRQVKFMRQSSCNVVQCAQFIVHLGPLYNQHVLCFMPILQDQEYNDDILNYYRGLTLSCLRLYGILLIISVIYQKNESLFRNTTFNYKITPRGKHKLFYDVIFRNALQYKAKITYINFVSSYLFQTRPFRQPLPPLL